MLDMLDSKIDARVAQTCASNGASPLLLGDPPVSSPMSTWMLSLGITNCATNPEFNFSDHTTTIISVDCECVH
eukprot:5675054-Amphidinium_carterae.1